MKRVVLACIAAIALIVSSIVFAASADAAVQNKSCSAGGFTGWITLSSSNIQYRIYKGSNRGGNSANVNMSDFNANPPSHWNSPDNLIQDNAYHILRGPIGGYDGINDVSFGIIFDKSGAPDPSCGVVFKW